MKLEQCTACGGFVPAAVSSCPHCSTRRSKVGAALAVLGSGAIAFTLMACYGAAPCGDGNPNCRGTTPSPDSSATPANPPSAPMPGVDGGK